MQPPWRQISAERRSDIYLLAPLRPLTLAKLRGGERLEIKRFLRFKGALQEWAVRRCPAFPLDADELERFTKFIGAPHLTNRLCGQSAAHLMASLIEAEAGVEPVIVRKSRLVFARDGRRAEIARVDSERLRAFSVAVEAPSPGLAAPAVDELGLGGLPNRSYAEALGNARSTRPMRRLGDMSRAQPDDFSSAPDLVGATGFSNTRAQGAMHEEA